MNLAKAKDIMDKVRLAYKPGFKSNNKAYSTDTKKESVSLPALKKESATWPLSGLSPSQKERFRKRFENSEKADHVRPKGPSGSIQRWGKKLWLAKSFEMGNCMEMAACSMHLAIDAGVDKNRVWYGAISKPGDHAFCLIGSVPMAGKVRGLKGTALIIDPWLHVFCYAFEYPEFSRRRLEEWSQKGKRVFAAGGWASTNGKYKENFLDGPLIFQH